jgi:hypothetical protein
VSAGLPPLFASLESILVFAAIVLISALSNWLKQRQERKQAEARGPKGPVPPTLAPRPVFEDDEDLETLPPLRPVAKPLDWQEELRRLLEGDQPRPAPPPPPLPPPPPVVPSPVPVFDAPPPVPDVPPPQPEIVTTSETQDVSIGGRGRLQESAAAFLRGTQVIETAEARLQSALEQVASAKPAAVGRATLRRSAETAARLREMLGNPTSLRQAILASIVLGPPRSLEERASRQW